MARDDLARQFGVRGSRARLERATTAAIGRRGALLRYLKELQPAACRSSRADDRAAGGDDAARRDDAPQLELVESLRGGSTRARCSPCSTAR
jgi:hypothetical protein